MTKVCVCVLTWVSVLVGVLPQDHHEPPFKPGFDVAQTKANGALKRFLSFHTWAAPSVRHPTDSAVMRSYIGSVSLGIPPFFWST
jgi:hypothetical protein